MWFIVINRKLLVQEIAVGLSTTIDYYIEFQDCCQGKKGVFFKIDTLFSDYLSFLLCFSQFLVNHFIFIVFSSDVHDLGKITQSPLYRISCNITNGSGVISLISVHNQQFAFLSIFFCHKPMSTRCKCDNIVRCDLYILNKFTGQLLTYGRFANTFRVVYTKGEASMNAKNTESEHIIGMKHMTPTKKPVPTVAAIHDLSGYGRCSLAVITPILSVMGLQTVAVPTAVLSTHTGGFGDMAIVDLTNYIANALAHYKKIKLDFDCIYTGFLASQQQISHCLDYIASYKNALAVVDPVMGDNGKTYKTYTQAMCDSMVSLVKAADLITPNKTEMYMLLKKPFSPSPLTVQEAKSNLLRLSELGPSKVIVTGLELADMTICNIGYDRDTHSFWRVICSYVPASYPGTGDIYASIVVASILKGDSLAIAMERATRFLELTIKTTFSYGSDPKQGVMLEKNLAWLIEGHSKGGYESM